MLTTIAASRQLVLARLGAPAPLLPGERYRHRSSQLRWIYERYGDYIDAVITENHPDAALHSLLAVLEVERERDYQAFHYGRELLLADLCVHVECPSSDPEPSSFAASDVVCEPAPRIKLPRKPAPPQNVELRARVLGRLGRPYGSLPGETMVVESSPALTQIRADLDALEDQPLSEDRIERTIGRLAAVREHDWQAFCYGRSELLSLLPIELELPTPAGASPCSAIQAAIAG